MRSIALNFCFWTLVPLTLAVWSDEDDDICQSGNCEQVCVNNLNSYDCNCMTGWKLRDDGYSCKPESGEPLMIFSTETSIHGYWLETMMNFTIVENLQSVAGISLDANYTYWLDAKQKKIFRSLLNGTKRESIITNGLSNPNDIAVDWITGNVYFGDLMYRHIGVCNDNGDSCKVLINDITNGPHSIAVMPSSGKIYWSVQGDHPHIAVSYMNGFSKEIFVELGYHYPSVLTIDYVSNRLYWIDDYLEQAVDCIDLDGTGRQTVLRNVVKRPRSIAVFGNYLYWTDTETSNIYSCNKFTGENVTSLVEWDEHLYDIHIYHSNFNMNQSNPCALKPCSQLCLLAENQTYTCACTMGTELGMDGHTCRDSMKQKHIAIAAGNAIVIYHELLGRFTITSNVTEDHINTMTYDPREDALIAVNDMAHSIFRYTVKSNEVYHMESIANEVIECIAFDYLGNNLYKSNGRHKKIEVQSLDTNEKTEFSYQESPSDMVLVPEEGIMFIVFRSSNSLHIDRVQMDGQGSRVHIVEQGLVGPKISLAYDKDANEIFWADEGAECIESADYQGQHKRLFRGSITSPVSIAVLDTDIFWTSRRSANLSWTDKKQVSADIKTLNIDFGQPVDVPLLQPIDGFYTRGLHPCSRNNGGCSHICLVTDAKNRLCACPLNFVINSDMKTCKLQTLYTSSDINKTCNNGNFWIGLCAGLLAFVAFLVIYYIKRKKPNFMKKTPSRNFLDGILIERRSNNLASTSNSTIETL